MPFRRANRPNWYFQARTRTGWKQLSAGTADRRLALKIESMWHDLAHEERAWDVLAPVLGGDLSIGELFDAYRDALGKVPELRRRMNDTNLEPLVAEYLTLHAPNVAPDTLAHIAAHLRALVPEGATYPASRATPQALDEALVAYRASDRPASGTRRKVHSSWSGFFTYLTRKKKLFDRNPMEDVDRPKAKRPTVRFFELDVVERLVLWQPTPERRAYYALIYGTGADVSDVLRATRADLDASTKDIRLAGTKAHTRDRIGRIASWAWPIVWAHAAGVLPTMRLFPSAWSRFTVSDWHREAMADLELSPRYPLKNARHHWAATHLRAGVPVAVVQRQLGHASAKHTLDTYGLFVPTGADRAAADSLVAAHETRRRGATTSANGGAK